MSVLLVCCFLIGFGGGVIGACMQWRKLFYYSMYFLKMYDDT